MPEQPGQVEAHTLASSRGEGVAINAYAPQDRDTAEAYAAEIGGYVSEGYNEHGWVAVRHHNPDGLAVTYWSSIGLPDGTVLARRDSIREGDVVVSSHSGKRTVAKAVTRGDPAVGPGTTYLTLDGLSRLGPEVYPADSFIPVVSRAEPKRYEYAAFLVGRDAGRHTGSGGLVGFGPTERRSLAQSDVDAWTADGYETVLRRRVVGE